MTLSRAGMALALLLGLSLTACDLLEPEPGDGIEYLVERFEVVVQEEDWSPFPIAELSASLSVVNGRTDSLHLGYGLEFGLCALHLEAVPLEQGSGPRIWRSQHRKTWPESTWTGCAVGSASLGPGDTLRGGLRASYPLATILADSLPAGLYDIDAEVVFGGGARVDLGRIRLPTSRHPLPRGVVRRDGFRYRVHVGTDGAGAGTASVELEVAFSAGSGPPWLERDLSASCPVRILAFRDSIAPTTIPQPEPDWVWPEWCGLGKAAVRLGPGESRTFERTIQLSDVAGRAGDPGPYHLVAVIDVDGRPIRMEAGELMLGP